MIQLREVTAENFWDIIGLEVGEEQKDLVTSNAISIAQAKVQPECRPLAVYNDDIPVGFVMYCIDRDDDEYWIYRLMIDKSYQSRGYGREAMNLVLDEIKRDSGRNKVFLGVDPTGIASVKLYESLGFRYNGQIFGKERIMVLEH
ncbi:MAG TPA: GNAT family N-acetyltransferase [Clostridia bacterium]|nr:GNAT family N-acetyltransferase [Clostridia bacterium]